jgi:hypothetical protein
LVLKESLTQAALSMNKRGKFYSVAHKAISKRLDSWIIFLPDLLGIAQDQSENDEVSDVNESESDNKFLDENSTYSTKKDISTNNNSWGWILVLISTIEESVDSLKEKGKECSDHSKLTNKLLNSFKKHLDIHKNLWSPWGQI